MVQTALDVESGRDQLQQMLIEESRRLQQFWKRLRPTGMSRFSIVLRLRDCYIRLTLSIALFAYGFLQLFICLWKCLFRVRGSREFCQPTTSQKPAYLWRNRRPLRLWVRQRSQVQTSEDDAQVVRVMTRHHLDRACFVRWYEYSRIGGETIWKQQYHWLEWLECSSVGDGVDDGVERDLTADDLECSSGCDKTIWVQQCWWWQRRTLTKWFGSSSFGDEFGKSCVPI